MKKALIIDLSLDQDFFLLFERDINFWVKSHYVNGFNPEYPAPENFSLVVFSGSQYSINDEYDWLDYAMDYYLKCRKKSIPVLGICYGHQLIARAHGGKEAVGIAEKPEMGFIEVEILSEKSVFSGLPKKFSVIGAHYDEVKKVPENFEVIAKSLLCPVQAM
ncbi:gamma-glutamyl-gamma-aminobutyrate hydrolase family protein, partial [candidate division WOR-3 bacterium]|nr:gamma-glutamyl-gamma-aminobutyrate hydrolase family protein [candidate division WOR-3 bacterium]